MEKNDGWKFKPSNCMQAILGRRLFRKWLIKKSAEELKDIIAKTLKGKAI
ncbi:hypothetical protein LIT32_15920 [Bacillus sp. CMF21]|nr:hypothetical protein [Metabacillus dongyingensis]UAL50702.1 hypothetical protein K8L98_15835 [Metabacillus dongyingensis]USK26970.1 hypothetical protein LIT32_15920 [Bacillus sp. CMF21]